MKYPSNPEIIASLEIINKEGEAAYLGGRIISLQVRQVKGDTGTVDVDICGYPKQSDNLVVRFSYPELMEALASAALNAEHES